MSIRVLQGNEYLASDNHEIGKFCLDGIPPEPKGQQKVLVTFNIDVNNILSIHANAVSLDGVEESLTIAAETLNLSTDHIL